MSAPSERAGADAAGAEPRGPVEPDRGSRPSGGHRPRRRSPRDGAPSAAADARAGDGHRPPACRVRRTAGAAGRAPRLSHRRTERRRADVHERAGADPPMMASYQAGTRRGRTEAADCRPGPDRRGDGGRRQTSRDVDVDRTPRAAIPERRMTSGADDERDGDIDLAAQRPGRAGRRRLEHAVVLSADGLLMAASAGWPARTPSTCPRSRPASRAWPGAPATPFGGGAVRQTIIEMESGVPLRDRGRPGRLPRRAGRRRTPTSA